MNVRVLSARRFAASLAFALCCAGCQYALDLSNSRAIERSTVQRTAGFRPTSDENWPAWRGWNSSGIGLAGGLPLHWSATENVRWRASVPGQGHSSPIVWDDHILLTTATGASDQPTLKLLSYRRGDGTLRWEAEAATVPASQTHIKNGFASPTPCTDGTRIYAFFGSAGLYCYNFTGQELWQAELGPLEHIWGTASSPVLFGDLVIQLCDQQSGSFLVALDKYTGREVWRTPRDSYGCWSTPVIAHTTVAGQARSELIINGTGTSDEAGGRVTAYDPFSGAVLWHVTGTTDIVCPTPLIGPELIYSASGRNGSILAIRPGGSGDVTDAQVAWRKRHGGPYVPSGVVYRDRLYILNDTGILTAYDAATGKQLWRHRLRGTFWASLVAGDGKLYATDEIGTTYVVAAADEFQLLAANQLNEQVLATPALAGQDLILRTATHLLCITPHAAPADDTLPADPDIASPSDLVPFETSRDQ